MKQVVCVMASTLLKVGLFGTIAGCGSKPQTAADQTANEFAGETRDTRIVHEPCEATGHRTETFKGEEPLASAHPYVTHVYGSATDATAESCSFADLNGDGRIDSYTYFSPDGKIRRREASYGTSEAIDEIAVYKDGNLELVMRETNFDGKLDTWDYYEQGRLVRRERDKSGAGRIEEWWSFEQGSDAAIVVQANPRTGKPDPTQTFKLSAGAAGGALSGARAPGATSAKPHSSVTPAPVASSTAPASPAIPAAAASGAASSATGGVK